MSEKFKPETSRSEHGDQEGFALNSDDTFELWDLRVEVVAGPRPMICDHREGEFFDVIGELVIFPESGRGAFPMYPLAALLPLLPAKQRETHNNDWMSTDAEIACPDPHCGGLFRITRTKKSVFRHSETTAVPLPHHPTEKPS